MTNPLPGVPFCDLSPGLAEQRAEIDVAIARVLDSGYFIMGPELETFEVDFARAAGASHAVGVGNGLDAIALALEAAGIGPGDEVIVPAHTFIATWLAVRLAGATPVAAEPAPGSYNADLSTIAPALTPRTRAIVVVHLYGEPVAIEPILAFASRHGLVVIEDAAQAHGARRGGRLIGSLGHAAGFSFYPTKNLGAFGDAGAVTTSDPVLAQSLKRLRNYGSDRKYEHDSFGRNTRLDPIQAAILSVRLKKLEDWNTRRRAIAARYYAGLSDLPELRLPPVDPENLPVWHLFVIRMPNRDALAKHLKSEGIATLVHYPRPVYRFAPFAGNGPAMGTPADRICTEILSLPMGPHQSEAQTDRVIRAIRSYFGQAA